MNGALGRAFLLAAMAFSIGVLVAVPKADAIRPLTEEQEAFIAAQVEAQFGPFEKIRVRRLGCCGNNGARWPMVQILTDPRILPEERSIYGLLDDEHSREPCIIVGLITIDHAAVTVGEWPAGACAP